MYQTTFGVTQDEKELYSFTFYSSFLFLFFFMAFRLHYFDIQGEKFYASHEFMAGVYNA